MNVRDDVSDHRIVDQRIEPPPRLRSFFGIFTPAMRFGSLPFFAMR